MDSILIKTLAAVILGFVISAVLGKYLVPALRRWKAGYTPLCFRWYCGILRSCKEVPTHEALFQAALFLVV